ncbi:MAG TPA: hypothetical protein VJ885_19260 [Thermoanaerobaculia bacterium]|nr:hypothetical protein [Thermoanaerobaculia bacterium]
MSDERHKYIEVIGVAPEGTMDVQRAAFQAGRQSAERLAEEAGVRLGDVQHIAEIADEEETGRGPLRYRVRFSVEAKVERKGTGFRVD